MCGEAFVFTWGLLERPHFEDSKTWLTLPDVLARSKDRIPVLEVRVRVQPARRQFLSIPAIRVLLSEVRC
jgi:hypothetical protein